MEFNVQSNELNFVLLQVSKHHLRAQLCQFPKTSDQVSVLPEHAAATATQRAALRLAPAGTFIGSVSFFDHVSIMLACNTLQHNNQLTGWVPQINTD